MLRSIKNKFVKWRFFLRLQKRIKCFCCSVLNYKLQIVKLNHSLNVYNHTIIAEFQVSSKISKSLINYPKAIILSDNSKCIGCDKDKNQIEFSKVRLKDIVENWEDNVMARK